MWKKKWFKQSCPHHFPGSSETACYLHSVYPVLPPSPASWVDLHLHKHKWTLAQPSPTAELFQQTPCFLLSQEPLCFMAILIFANQPESHSGRKGVFLAVAQAGHRSAPLHSCCQSQVPTLHSLFGAACAQVLFYRWENQEPASAQPCSRHSSQESAPGCAAAHLLVCPRLCSGSLQDHRSPDSRVSIFSSVLWRWVL